MNPSPPTSAQLNESLLGSINEYPVSPSRTSHQSINSILIDSDSQASLSSLRYNDADQSTPSRRVKSTAKTNARGSAYRQFGAMMHKNFILKRRYWVSTIFELLSPVLVLSILVLGWVLSREGIQSVGSQVYANDTSIVQTIVSTVNLYPQGSNGTECFRTPGLPPSAALCFDGNNIDLLNAVLGYNGPTSVPIIDEFISLHQAFVYAVKNSSSPASSIEALDSLTDHQLTNIIYLGQLAFSPDTPAIRDLVSLLNFTHPLLRTVDVVIYPSEQAAVDASLDHVRMWAILAFNELDVAGGHVDYKIRMNYTALPSTSTTVSKFALGLDDSYRRYYYSGFLTLQLAIDNAVLLVSSRNKTFGTPDFDARDITTHQVIPPLDPLQQSSRRIRSSKRPPWLQSFVRSPRPPPPPQALQNETSVTTVPMPTPGYQGSSFYSSIGPVISLVFAMCMLFPVSRLIKSIVEEKESRMKETMKMMSLSDSVYALSWLFTALIQFTLTAAGITILLHFTLVPNTDATLLFFFFFCLVLAQITFSFLVSVFFNSAKVAGIVGPLVLFACVIPRYAFFNTDPNEAIPGKSLVSFFAPTAFTLGADLIVNYEGANTGLQWSNIQDDSFSMLRVLLFLIFDAVLYGWLAWYLQHVLPNEFGQRLPPWFCLMPSFYFSSLHPSKQVSPLDETGSEDAEYIEAVPSSLADKAVVQINGLRKVFIEGRGSNKRETVAVNSLNLTLYEGQITALLGHNGAGKSTTISMLTGLISPSAGDCVMYGHSIVSDLDLVRQSLGICPQYDVLNDRMTVKEHLVMYAIIKGVAAKDVNKEVNRSIDEIGLREKRHTWASALSGGQRRKLSVAIAFIGGSKVVFLDEPTSGLDPYSRRMIWDILRLNKPGRVIIFTSHYTDEADMLGDRIAIMGEGKLRCAGSPLYLKSKYGIGYNLTLTRGSKRFKLEDLSRLILKHVLESRLLSSAGGEVSFRLPIVAVSKFPNLFADIEKRRKRYGIGSYGISMTTIEDVFLRISQTSWNHSGDDVHEEAEPINEEPTPHHRKSSASFFIGSELPEEAAISVAEQLATRARAPVPRWLQFRELVRKRYICALRDLSGKFYEIILPVLIVALVLMILKINVNPAGPEILLDSSLYTSVQRDDVLSFGNKDIHTSTHIPYTHSLEQLENGTLYFLDHRPAIIMEKSDAYTSLGMSTNELLPSLKSHVGQRYGAIVVNDTVYTRFNWSSGAIAKDNIAIPTALSLLHNASYIHALPVLVAELQQARWASNRMAFGMNDGWNNSINGALYNVRNHPLPLTSRENLRLQTYLTLFAALFVLLPFTFVTASFVLFIVKERACKSKHLQLSSGVNPTMYWLATFAWDALNYTFLAASVMVVFFGYQNAEFVGTSRAASATFLLFWMYGLACIPLSYCYSFLFDNSTSAQVGILGLHCLTGFGLVVTDFILDNIGNYKVLNASLKPFYRIFPPFSLGEGLIAMSTRGFSYLNSGSRPDAFAWEVTGRNISYMAVECVGYLFLTLLIEYDAFRLVIQLWNSLWSRHDDLSDADDYSQHEDEDVAAERRRIERGERLTAIDEDSMMPSADPSRKSSMRASMSGTFEASTPPRSPNINGRALARRSLSSATSPERPSRHPTGGSTLLVPGALQRETDEMLRRSRRRSTMGAVDDDHTPRRKFSSDSVDSLADLAIEQPGADVLVMKQLRKVWNRKEGGTRTVAVHSLSLGVQRGVTFGFLGMNGAGKTSTLKMLTGDELPTSGTALINGLDCVKEIEEVHRAIGYCPQFDPLIEILTGREQLTLYARLRGLPSHLVSPVVESMLTRIGLGALANRRCGSYSGGNKRKLSLAIALIGDPSLLLLDEPSTGMDPMSRRFMWSVISTVADSRSVILTSHSMEEVEALCQRVGVMVAGRLRCLGSIQHLKSRFGDGYHLDLNCREGCIASVKEFIARTFPGSVVEEEHACRLKYGLPPTVAVSLSAAFGSIESAKQRVGIEDYSISQSSLEQIFLSTVRRAEELDTELKRLAGEDTQDFTEDGNVSDYE